MKIKSDGFDKSYYFSTNLKECDFLSPVFKRYEHELSIEVSYVSCPEMLPDGIILAISISLSKEDESVTDYVEMAKKVLEKDYIVNKDNALEEVMRFFKDKKAVNYLQAFLYCAINNIDAYMTENGETNIDMVKYNQFLNSNGLNDNCSVVDFKAIKHTPK